MANAIVQLAAETLLTLTLDLFPLGSDTAAASAKTLTEQTNRKGVYLATVTEALTGWHLAIAKEGTRPAAIGFVLMSDDTSVHYVVEHAKLVDAAIVRTELATELARIDAAISSRSTYAGADTSGTTTLLSRLTSGRAGNLDNLDATISSRLASASYTAAPSAGTVATAVRSELATELAHLDADVSSRSTYAGADTSGTTTLLSRLTGTRAGLLDNLDAAITTRLAAASYTSPPAAATIAALIVTGGPITVSTGGVHLAATQSAYAPAKAGDAMTLTSQEREDTAAAIEAAIIDEADSNAVLQAIVDKIAEANPSLDDLTLGAIASAVRTELTTELARIDAAISTRSTYAGGDTSGTTTLLSRLTAPRAGYLDNLDATISSRLAAGDYTAPPSAAAVADEVRIELAPELAHLDADVSSRSTYAGGDTGGTTTLLSRLSGERAANLDNLDATVSSRLPTASYSAPPAAATVASAVRVELAAELGRLDASVSSRLASVSYTAAPNAAAVAAAVETLLSQEHGSGSWEGGEGGGGSDPLENQPSDYEEGQIGNLLQYVAFLPSIRAQSNLITAGGVTVVSDRNPYLIEVLRGASYLESLGNAITLSDAAWAVPAEAEIVVKFAPGQKRNLGPAWQVDAEYDEDDDGLVTITLEFTAEDLDRAVGEWPYTIYANSEGSLVPLRSGTLRILSEHGTRFPTE